MTKPTPPKWLKVQVNNARYRASTSGVPFTITVDEMHEAWDEQGGRCYWFDVPLGPDPDRPYHPCTPSLDRVMPDLGYTPGNVVWACLAANVAKRDTDPDSWETFLSLMRASMR